MESESTLKKEKETSDDEEREREFKKFIGAAMSPKVRRPSANSISPRSVQKKLSESPMSSTQRRRSEPMVLLPSKEREEWAAFCAGGINFPSPQSKPVRISKLASNSYRVDFSKVRPAKGVTKPSRQYRRRSLPGIAEVDIPQSPEKAIHRKKIEVADCAPVPSERVPMAGTLPPINGIPKSNSDASILRTNI